MALQPWVGGWQGPWQGAGAPDGAAFADMAAHLQGQGSLRAGLAVNITAEPFAGGWAPPRRRARPAPRPQPVPVDLQALLPGQGHLQARPAATARAAAALPGQGHLQARPAATTRMGMVLRGRGQLHATAAATHRFAQATARQNDFWLLAA